MKIEHACWYDCACVNASKSSDLVYMLTR